MICYPTQLHHVVGGDVPYCCETVYGCFVSDNTRCYGKDVATGIVVLKLQFRLRVGIGRIHMLTL